jgi:hypothetical protein
MQTTSHVFMVRPACFGYNEQTAVTNAFQSKSALVDDVNALAQKEFDEAVIQLRNAGVSVNVIEDNPEPIKPDAVFPNNWISMHADRKMVLYPMCTPNRRAERRADIVNEISARYDILEVIDLSVEEEHNHILEGTGSIVFDHVYKTAYACLSPRTDKGLFEELCEKLGYQPIAFFAQDAKGQEIYHTNVMMCIAEKFAVICSESITNPEERTNVLKLLKQGNREIVDISFSQMEQFAGNMLALRSSSNEDLIVLSQSAYDSLTAQQRAMIQKNNRPIIFRIPTIESIGGGSARCMIAEIFCSPKSI